MVSIYKLFFNNKPNKCYIGITIRELEIRKRAHIKDMIRRDSIGKNTKKTRWLKRNIKQGNKLRIKLLYICDIEDGLKIENKVIKEYKEKGFKLYNSNSGGGGVLYHTPETINKISKGNKGKIVKKETLIKMSESQKGIKKPQTKETKLKKSGINNKQSKPVVGENVITGEILEYNSGGEAYRDLKSKGIKINRSAIYRSISGVYKSAGGFKWKYKQ